MLKGIPCKRKQKEKWGSNTYIRQIDFKPKTVTRDKEGHYIMIKGSLQQENTTILNIYARGNTKTPNSQNNISSFVLYKEQSWRYHAL